MGFEEFMVIMRVYSKAMGHKDLYSLLLGKQTIHQWLDKVEKLETENLEELKKKLAETKKTISILPKTDTTSIGSYQALEELQEGRIKYSKERIATVHECREELKQG